MSAPSMLKGCFSSVSGMLQRWFRHVSEMFQKRFRDDSGILKGCFDNVLGVSFNVSNLFQGFFSHVFKALSEMSVRRRIKWQWKFGSLSGTVSTFCAFMGTILGTLFKQRFCGRRCVTHCRPWGLFWGPFHIDRGTNEYIFIPFCIGFGLWWNCWKCVTNYISAKPTWHSQACCDGT